MRGTTSHSRTQLPPVAGALALCLVICAGCASTRVDTPQAELAHQRLTEPLIVIPPISYDPDLEDTCDSLGDYLCVEVPKRFDGKVIYAEDIQSLRSVVTWNNLIKNGAIDCQEVATIARATGCKSALATHVINTKPYPPFRMVVSMLWIDARTGDVISRLYNDVDLTDSDTKYKYSNFVGQGPAKELYERFFYSEDLLQTAMLSPERFMHFVAAHSVKVTFGDRHDVPWWYLWRLF